MTEERCPKEVLQQEIIKLEDSLNKDEILTLLTPSPAQIFTPIYMSQRGEPLNLSDGALVSYFGVALVEVKNTISRLLDGLQLLVLKMTCSSKDGKTEDHLKIYFKLVNGRWQFKDATLLPLELFTQESGEESWLIHTRYSLSNKTDVALRVISTARQILEM